MVPEFAEHLEVDVGEKQLFGFSIVHKAKIFTFPFKVSCQAAFHAVGLFLTHSNIKQSGFLEGVLNYCLAMEDEIQSGQSLEWLNVLHLKVFGRSKNILSSVVILVIVIVLRDG
ncbi:MAG: hypothetical protein JKX84_09910 [Flavobacteriales bacterium]|nr:hypothetical protein [Flavobacteriales bacterium]